MSLLDIIREQYATGRIDHHELERRTELAWQREHPFDAFPETWAKLPTCEHDFIDITTLGSRDQITLCTVCGDEQIRLFEAPA